MSVWVNKKIKKLLKVWCYEVMIFLRIKIKIKLKCNVCDNITAEEECYIWYKVKKYSLIVVLDSALFWVIDFLQIDYTLRTVFYDVNDIVMIIE